MQEMVIYKPGNTNIRTTVTDGRCDYTGLNMSGDGRPAVDLTVAEYLERLGPDYVCIQFDDALGQIKEVQSDIYIKPWKEISEDDYMYALECLPPEKWMTVDNVNIFRMCEYTTCNITGHYAHHEDRFFQAYRRSSDGYDKLSREVKEAV